MYSKIKLLWYIFILALILLFLVSCKTTEIEYRDKIVDNYVTNTVHDTIRENTRDSIFVKVEAKNDTVFCTKYIEKTRWREKIVESHDTCYRDSIVVEYKEKVKEVKVIPKIFRLSLTFTIIIIIFAFVKLIQWLKIR